MGDLIRPLKGLQGVLVGLAHRMDQANAARQRWMVGLVPEVPEEGVGVSERLEGEYLTSIGVTDNGTDKRSLRDDRR